MFWTSRKKSDPTLDQVARERIQALEERVHRLEIGLKEEREQRESLEAQHLRLRGRFYAQSGIDEQPQRDPRTVDFITPGMSQVDILQARARARAK